LLRAIEPSLRDYLSSLVGTTDADDVAQEVLFIVYRKLPWLQSPEVFRAWMFRIASRVAMRHLKKARRTHAQMSEEELGDVPATEAPPSSQLRDALPTMAGLSPGSRTVLVLHFLQEMSLPEVAAILGIPLGTAKSRLAYGLAALRKLIGNSRSSYE
jgi:RNA polymerase sigma-70 factor, ECF subfamily